QRDYNRVALVSFITHRPTTGGNLPGTATETHAGVSIRSMGFRKWSWSLAGFYAERDPADPSRPETDSAGMDGQATWAIHPKFGLRWTAASVRQSDPALDADVFRAAFGIVWFPKGRERRKQG
ncbi:MAG: hypothetical protein GTO30_06050, partial [Acidobacteria bacterium]|nr:hypothetical protein [Acidobacteriota bacterium]NIQ85664.1 hypothetical protein [Acidobacteriota bacterium]